MRKTILLCIVAGIVFIPLTNGALSYAQGNYVETIRQTTSRISLMGKLKTGGGLRSGTDPIVAELQNSMLLISFQKDVGTLHVTITGTQGRVYAIAVDTATQSVLDISLAGLPAGSYTVTFSNERGTMWGEFEI